MELDAWHDLFVAAAGASAALAGLIIVAMSVNITTILGIPSMTSRAAATIATLILTVVVSIAALIPGQAKVALGIEIVVFAAAALYMAVDSARNVLRARAGTSTADAVLKGLVAIIPAALIFVGGAVIIATLEAGLYFVAVGILLAFIGSVTNAWVLLVEILR